jgi:hypothetical protein
MLQGGRQQAPPGSTDPGPPSRSSRYRGVTKHRRSGRWAEFSPFCTTEPIARCIGNGLQADEMCRLCGAYCDWASARLAASQRGQLICGAAPALEAS